MNTTFKFRIWDKEYKTWRELPDLYGDYQANAHRTYGEGFSIHNFFNTNDGVKFKEGVIVAQQYTALKDKNGKEIYEGDILLYRNTPREVRFGEFWNGVDDFIGFFIQSREVTHRNFGTSAKIDFTSSEIIGNIFENPELLKL